MVHLQLARLRVLQAAKYLDPLKLIRPNPRLPTLVLLGQPPSVMIDLTLDGEEDGDAVSYAQTALAGMF